MAKKKVRILFLSEIWIEGDNYEDMVKSGTTCRCSAMRQENMVRSLSITFLLRMLTEIMFITSFLGTGKINRENPTV